MLHVGRMLLPASHSVCCEWPRVVRCCRSSRVMFYKVPFAAVPDLVARRQVLLQGGHAYVRDAQVCAQPAGVDGLREASAGQHMPPTYACSRRPPCPAAPWP